MDELEIAKDNLARSIVGEIVLSDKPEAILKKWRNIFNFSQKDVAASLGITSSVISDYESGRRKSPGIKIIKKYVTALIEMDLKKGGDVVRSFSQTEKSSTLSEAILDIKEFSEGVTIKDFTDRINGVFVTKEKFADRKIYGYTIIDSIKAISDLSFNQMLKLYGTTTQRAMIFTKVTTGKTPMVAIKLTNLNPGMVVLHGLTSVYDVAKNIADAEGIPLVVCKLERPEDIVEALKYFN
ncbi:MAG: helix-turn-helix domain-containing protein [Candidatus Aenigmarchaeota archaeon]|nr:helix-turn-helix domain-containing protein [Candidatus Aenigmarchaeota archaeon]